ncbi:uncharacterized protein KLLA0_B03784g [Kluyveromyces lactis]|uniref:KLLA0B03784p n=1 Tax=Kluyveromyces lactis (strain ATCC 8585 / CBS 2359 / DSM 70799 / NBRC 1267 / NRRL Y-1140 / WM37) TaxID=284590 RepID=Q6CWI7_KLULA|nr:uncharacterized protein KLLA0_B03784g [Kluyveromyces lactis]CAH02095.1 KLLA0B03784p [Kluyveromyces lactis]|eukprot:XP_451702.1 uncharacterized protein KLLA0_B03784g [Kluyveromyces lactis]
MSKVISTAGREVLIRSEKDKLNNFSFLPIIDKVDVFPRNYANNEHFQKNVYMLKSHTGVDIGFVLKLIVLEIREVCGDLATRLFTVNDDSMYVRFKPTSFQERDDLTEELCQLLRVKSKLECIKTWRDEKYAVYVEHEPYVLIERGLAGAFGIVTYGVHVNGFFRDSTSGEIKFWIPRRSATKPTWPSMLDNIVAGGIGHPHGIYETVLKECMEEATLSADVIEKNIKSVGSVSYLFFQGDIEEERFEHESAFITGEVEYIFDVELPPDVIPVPNDGEVEQFGIFGLQEVVDALKRGEFKPNCALIMVEFLIRHGYITPEIEPNYTEIISRMHRQLPFPVMR